MGRIHTLRGTIEASRAVPTDPQLIFDYASVDQTKAWKVIDICFLPKKQIYEAPGLNKGGVSAHTFQLATDLGFDTEVLDASENRTFAWQTVSTRNSEQLPEILSPTYSMDCVDPDHLITDQLYLSYVPWTEANENGIVWEWSYVIRLEALKITSNESILQAVKGKGQQVYPVNPWAP